MENNNENQKSSKSKFWLYFGIAIAAIIIAFQLCSDDDSSDNYGSSCGDSCVFGKEYAKFIGTYKADLTLAQSGHMTTIVINPDGSGYFMETLSSGDSYKDCSWWPADNKGGIQFGGGGGDQQSCYFMNKQRTKMYWGLNNYMSDRDGFKVTKVK